MVASQFARRISSGDFACAEPRTDALPPLTTDNLHLPLGGARPSVAPFKKSGAVTLMFTRFQVYVIVACVLAAVLVFVTESGVKMHR